MITLEQWGNWSARENLLQQLPHRVQVLLSSIWANNVLHLFEQQYPTDDRPRKAIEIAFDFSLTGIVDTNAARAAAYAAANAARAAAYASAAYYAAWAAYCADNTVANYDLFHL